MLEGEKKAGDPLQIVVACLSPRHDPRRVANLSNSAGYLAQRSCVVSRRAPSTFSQERGYTEFSGRTVGPSRELPALFGLWVWLGSDSANIEYHRMATNSEQRLMLPFRARLRHLFLPVSNTDYRTCQCSNATCGACTPLLDAVLSRCLLSHHANETRRWSASSWAGLHGYNSLCRYIHSSKAGRLSFPPVPGPRDFSLRDLLLDTSRHANRMY